MSNTKYWLLESGSYSDYSVRAIIEGDRATAEAVAARANELDKPGYDEYEVSEIELVRSPDDVKLSTTHYFELVVTPGGDAKSRAWSYSDLVLGNEQPESHRARWTPESAPYPHRGTFGVRVGTDDPERSIKIASDMMAQMRAEASRRPTRCL